MAFEIQILNRNNYVDNSFVLGEHETRQSFSAQVLLNPLVLLSDAVFVIGDGRRTDKNFEVLARL